MPQDIRNEWVAGLVDGWFGPKGSHRHQKRRNFPAFRNLKALPATLMDKDKVGGGFSLVRRWVGHPAVSRQLDASKARCPTGATAACPDTCKCG